jgi:hypothetical protein
MAKASGRKTLTVRCLHIQWLESSSSAVLEEFETMTATVSFRATAQPLQSV